MDTWNIFTRMQYSLHYLNKYLEQAAFSILFNIRVVLHKYTYNNNKQWLGKQKKNIYVLVIYYLALLPTIGYSFAPRHLWVG